MLSKQFTDPLGSKLPALEQSILKLRALQMLLVLFYAEELKRDVLELIQATDSLMTRLDENKVPLERVPKGTKKAVDKALNALVADGAITGAEKAEIVELIDYRNVIGYQMHNLLADVSPERMAREMAAYAPDLLHKYDYSAVNPLQHFHKRLDGLYRTHHYVSTFRYNGLLFRSAEKTFLAEIKRLERKISRLTDTRRTEVEILNTELSLKGTEFSDELNPQHPLNRYDNGRLTARGVEICYRLFDIGKSAMAVAHLTDLSLIASRNGSGSGCGWRQEGLLAHGWMSLPFHAGSSMRVMKTDCTDSSRGCELIQRCSVSSTPGGRTSHGSVPTTPL